MPVELEYINCPYCGKDESEFWATENGYTAVKCIQCGFVYVNPRPTLESISDAAQAGLHETESGTVSVTGSFRRYRVSGFKKRLQELFPSGELRRRGVRWLDIGTGFGELLLALQEIARKDSVIEGIEPNETKLEKAKQLGLNVTNRSLNEISNAYDFVSLVNVFSHLPDPLQFISEVKQKLVPTGEVLLVTGNGGEVQSDKYPGSYYFPHHLTFAGEKHVIGILERAGFELVKIRRCRKFLPENVLVSVAKTLVIGQPIWYKSPFRFLWVRARL